MNSRLHYLSSLCWFRRDLRCHDHAAFFNALDLSVSVHCVFIFDREILDALPRDDRRVEFIWLCVSELATEISRLGGSLQIIHGNASDEIPRLAVRLGVDAVFCNRDYEPLARQRDRKVELGLKQAGIEFITCKDQVIFEESEILTTSAKPYAVFTPYKRAWLKQFTPQSVRPFEPIGGRARLAQLPQPPILSLDELGFGSSHLSELRDMAGTAAGKRLLNEFAARITSYHEIRDYPWEEGGSRLSPHLRFGTISIRELVALAWPMPGRGAQTFLSELIWREFYQMLVFHHPEVGQGRAFKPQFEGLAFLNDQFLFEEWCVGRTGYPLVDAGMRQLNQTGCMHNRLRMVTASFLVKDLLVDWRWGERYFAQKLLDFDFAANNGGWQWCASTGCDAQPWFRIFNPVTQSERFDPKGDFIRTWIPELAACPDKWVHAPWRMPEPEHAQCGISYWPPLVDHARMRNLTLGLYKAAAVGGAGQL